MRRLMYALLPLAMMTSYRMLRSADQLEEGREKPRLISGGKVVYKWTASKGLVMLFEMKYLDPTIQPRGRLTDEIQPYR